MVTENRFELLEGDNPPVRIVLVSDIHIGTQREGYLEEVVKRINSLQPDIVLIDGDSIEEKDSELEGLSPLAGIDAPAYAVLGNHDYGAWGCPAFEGVSGKVEARLEELGIIVLRNEHEMLDVRGSRFALIGVDDVWSCMNDYGTASKGVPDEMPKLVLVHNNLGVKPEEVKGPGLVLAGHTHCGQVRLPFITEFVMGPGFGSVLGGRGRLDKDTEAYVTCGVTSGGIRFFTNPEISVIEIE